MTPSSLDALLSLTFARFMDLEEKSHALFLPMKEALCNPSALEDLYTWIVERSDDAPLSTQLLATWVYMISCTKNAPVMPHVNERLLQLLQLADQRVEWATCLDDREALDEAYTSLTNCQIDGAICEHTLLRQANINRVTRPLPSQENLWEHFLTPALPMIEAIFSQGVEDLFSLHQFMAKLPSCILHEHMLKSLARKPAFTMPAKLQMFLYYIQRLNQAPTVDTRQLHDLLILLNETFRNNHESLGGLFVTFRQACIELFQKPRIFMPRDTLLEATRDDWRQLEPILINEQKSLKATLQEFHARTNIPCSSARISCELLITFTQYITSLIDEMPLRRNNPLTNHARVLGLKNSCLVVALWLYQSVSWDSDWQIKNTMAATLRKCAGMRLFLAHESGYKEELILSENGVYFYLAAQDRISRTCYI